MTAPAPGPLGEEAARLVSAVQDWAARTLPADDGCTCSWCPVCQGLAVLRGERPDVTDRITDAVTAAASALSALATALSARPAPGAATGAGPAPVPEREPVQRIDLDAPGA